MRQDDGELLTERELAKLEKRIRQEYGAAQKELADTITQYFADFAVRDEQMKKLIGTEQNGKTWTEADYRQWRLAQIGRGERFKALQRRIAERYTNARETAESYVNDATPGIYSLNRNYAAYTIEQVAGDVGFDFWDEQTVRRLLVEQPELMPHYPEKRAIKRGIDLAYGQKQIAASVTSGILQGKSLKSMADDLQERIPEMSRNSALRAARTAVTGAQNAGRTDSYAAAEKMGVKTKRKWVATLDNRTRHEHGELDGQVVAVDEPFEVGGYSLMFPGDPSGPPHLIYNCRCRIKPVVEGHEQGGQRRARDPETGKSVLIENMSYAEWAGWKEKTSNNILTIYVEKIRSAGTVSDVENIMRKATKKEVNLFGMDLDLAKQNMEQILRLGNEYGYNFNKIETSSGRAHLGEVKRQGNKAEIITLRYPKKYYKDERSLLGELRKSAEAGEIPKLGRKNIGIYVTTHEFAHTLSEELTSRLYGYGKELKFWDEIETVYISAKKEKPEELGSYAFTNQNEFLAECFAYAKLGTQQNTYADEVLKIVDRYFRINK